MSLIFLLSHYAYLGIIFTGRLWLRGEAMKRKYGEVLVVILATGACLMPLKAEEPGRLSVPDTKYGQHILPDEKSLKNWKVYLSPIVLEREKLVKASYGNDSPEAAAVSFYSSIAKGDDGYIQLLSRRIRPEIKKSIAVQSKKEGNSFQELRIFAKLETDIAMTLEKTEGSFLANRDDMGRVLQYYGPFNVLIFLETPPRDEDGFVLLTKENNDWKILAVTGWLYNPGVQK